MTAPFPPDDVNCYMYVDDLGAQIYLLSLKPKLSYRIYNAGGHTVGGSELASLVRENLPHASIKFSADGPYSPFIQAMDDTRIRAELGITMRSMSDGVRDHIARAAQMAGSALALPTPGS